MSREQMIDFTCWIMRENADARQFGGLRHEAELLVDEYLRQKAA